MICSPLDIYRTQQFLVTGIVSGHDVVVSRGWRQVARGGLPNIAVVLDAAQQTKFNDSLRDLPVIETFGGEMPTISSAISVPVFEKEKVAYPRGAEVELVIGYAPPKDQKSAPMTPLRVLECNRIGSVLHLIPALPEEVRKVG